MPRYFEGLNAALSALYEPSPCCAHLSAAPTEDLFSLVKTAFEKAAAFVHGKKGFKGAMITQPEIIALVNETASAIGKAFPSDIETRMPEEMLRKLREDVFVFSGMKTYASLKEAASLLLTEDGTLKSFYNFKNDIEKLNLKYNERYLEAEYRFATDSSQMAAKWKEFEAGGDDFYLQYRTASDEKVREPHQALAGITLPPSDPFWVEYFPPNGWNCRCTTVQVRKTKYPLSDSAEALEKGVKATTTINKKGENKAAMFRFNSGIRQAIFPPNHPYSKVMGAAEAGKKVLEEKGKVIDLAGFIKGDSVSSDAVKKIIAKYAETHPENFRKGLEKVQLIKSKDYMMLHSMPFQPATMEWAGASTLRISTNTFRSVDFNPADELKGAFMAMRNKVPLSFKQEYAVESLWHEILHAKTASKPGSRTGKQTEAMETINQFCARHTYPQFMKAFGANASHQEAILDKGFGYTKWVTEFREALKKAGIDEKDAVNDLMPHLMSDYGSLELKKAKYLMGKKL